MTTAVTFFEIVKFLHVAAVVTAWGVTFAYPVLQRVAEKQDPRAVPYFWRAVGRVGMVIIGPGAGLILITGVVMVIDSPAFGFGDLFVTVGMIAIIVLIAFGPLFFTPAERRLAEAAEREIAAAGGGEVRFSEDYEAASRRYAMVGRINGLIVLIAIFFMVVKP
ncbi:MAG TPA: DUF2269 family protein [Thermoleophilaceae bacterium]|nr:DUF2269 family protein [Thermoleophilaceae bacterium]